VAKTKVQPQEESESTGDPQIADWIKRLDEVQVALPDHLSVVAYCIRCIYHTTVVIPAGVTPSGRRYEFQPGQARDVDPDDVNYLLSLAHEQRPCCSGEVKTIGYFEPC
jgi:hypothetical protein